jgi:hypothetical protein
MIFTDWILRREGLVEQLCKELRTSFELVLINCCDVLSIMYRLNHHGEDPVLHSNPLVASPEGICVNNRCCHVQEGGWKSIFFCYLQLVPNVKLYCSRLLLCKSIRKTQMYLSPLTLSKGSWAGGFWAWLHSLSNCNHTQQIFVDVFWNRNKYVLLHFVLCLPFLWNVQCNSLSKRCVAYVKCHRQSFTMHLMCLMTSWAVVCDVCYLEP